MTLRELAAAIGAELEGEADDFSVRGVTGLEDMAEGCLVYVSEAARLPQAEAGPALAALVPQTVERSSKPLLRVRPTHAWPSPGPFASSIRSPLARSASTRRPSLVRACRWPRA